MKRCSSLLILGLLFGAASAHAELYKWVGPDGKVHYSDVPPPPTAKQVETKAINSGASNSAGLPFELAEAVKNHPVTLYTGNACGPCDEGRKLLNARGIPFTEKTVNSNEDIAVFRQAGGQSNLPLLVIGRNKQEGFERASWAQALTAAGYPDSNKLPGTYRNPQATAAAPNVQPVAAKQSGKATKAQASSPQQPATELPPAAGNAPPGFRF